MGLNELLQVKHFNIAINFGSYYDWLLNLLDGTLALGSLPCLPPLGSQSRGWF